MKIAWITPQRIGDTLFQLPAMKFLKKLYPTILLDILAITEQSAAVLENHPCIHQIIVRPTDDMLAQLRGQYENVICGSPNAIGWHYVSALGATTILLGMMEAGTHASEQRVNALKKALLIESPCDDFTYDMHPTAIYQQKIQHLFEELKISQAKPLIGIHLGCHSMAKRRLTLWEFKGHHDRAWDPQEAIDFCQLIRQHYPTAFFLLTGSGSEAVLTKKVAKALPYAFDLSNKVSIQALAALMPALNCYVCPDTGPLHIAYSTSVPVVALFGPSNPAKNGPPPGRSRHSWIKNRDERVAKITAQEVFEQVMPYLLASPS